MQRYNTWLWPLIIVIVAAAVYIVIPGTGTPPIGALIPAQTFELHQGLDLQGGLQVLLEADVPEGQTIDPNSMRVAKQIVENRVNGLGVAEPLVQEQGDRRIVVELPGITDPQQAIDTLKQTGLLEFVHDDAQLVAAGMTLKTDCYDPTKLDCGPDDAVPPAPVVSPTLAPTLSASETVTASATITAPVAELTPEAPAQIFHTVMTGVAIKQANVVAQGGQVVVEFELTDEGSRLFSEFTSQNIGQVLAIVLDKVVISAPRINSAITNGRGIVEGNFTVESANQLALQLKYGSLPVPLRVAQSREIGPTLGEDSVRKSTIAGVIGLLAVIVFMILYYRLPGVVASIALLIYAIVTLALFKLIPVTLTLPGIAGFVLSIGVAVDANVLIFERFKEELRGGKSIFNSVEAGFNRAWLSIRDSNVSTLITCSILFWFGNTFGASIVKGFALTLLLGVAVSLFTAILVTRSVLHLFLDRIDFSEKKSWLGI